MNRERLLAQGLAPVQIPHEVEGTYRTHDRAGHPAAEARTGSGDIDRVERWLRRACEFRDRSRQASRDLLEERAGIVAGSTAGRAVTTRTE